MRRLFVLALLAIIHFSLHPWHFDAGGFSRPLRWARIASRSDYLDIVLNLAFYVLPALVGQWAFAEARTKLRTLFLMVSGLTLLSFTVEFLQLAIPGRFANLRDVFCNAVGALAGALLGWWIPPPARLFAHWKLPQRSSGFVIFLGAWMVWQAFPFIPYIHWHRFALIRESFLHPAWPVEEMADIFFVLAVVSLMASYLHLDGLLIATAAALLLPAQAFLSGSAFSVARVVAAGFALIATATVLRRPGRGHYIALALLITGWIVYRQLMPWQFATQPVNTFAWIPLSPLIEAQLRASSLRLLSGKFLLDAAGVWLYRRAGLSSRFAAFALLLILTVTEILQCYLPGRTPETTDLVLGLLAVWAVRSGEDSYWIDNDETSIMKGITD